jgi:hypothetical protein
MKTTDIIAFTIDRLPKGYVFTYSDFTSEVKSKEAVIKALNRMAAAGKISKLAKGKYYKPESTVFGNLQPKPEQIVKDLLKENEKVIGYLTGLSIYNKLALSNQLSNTIQIGKNEVRPSFKRERYIISFIKQRNNITKGNIPLLQILDSIRYIKKIPDSTIESACKRLLTILKKLTNEDKETMVRLALKYPPATRALLGAMLEELNSSIELLALFQSLNHISKFKLEGASSVLSNTLKWNIV